MLLLNLNNDLRDKTIIEIGSVRENKGKNSTRIFLEFCHENSMNLVSVDNDKIKTEDVLSLDLFNPKICNAVNMNEVDYVKTLQSFDYINIDYVDTQYNYLEMIKHLDSISKNISIICFNNIVVNKKVDSVIPYLIDHNWVIIDRNSKSITLSKMLKG